ncbi:MAG: hypothetical protein CSA11_10760 [Chloroflexi bacterium]|nr:MAG: hypothetical protein CSB13_03750 [Chloroflexota bacterium]PIE79782.1 MAG: hypothetical protein CSA11_10760 [Chloroflexota bacterium]
MKKEFLPYYISRAILSGALAIVIFGMSWQAIPLSIFFFSLFWLYLHSGWFKIDLTHPFFPLRRDQRAQLVQRKALIAALVVGVLTFIGQTFLSDLLPLPLLSVNLAIPLAIVVYFIMQFVLLSRA